MVLAVVPIVLFSLAQATTASKGDRTYQMTGKLTANKLPRSKLRGIKRKKHCLGAKQALGNRTLQGIETAYRTVVIEAPQGKDSFTVAGPLSPKAVLRKGGKS
jgi:hypothetical protein